MAKDSMVKNIWSCTLRFAKTIGSVRTQWRSELLANLTRNMAVDVCGSQSGGTRLVSVVLSAIMIFPQGKFFRDGAKPRRVRSFSIDHACQSVSPTLALVHRDCLHSLHLPETRVCVRDSHQPKLLVKGEETMCNGYETTHAFRRVSLFVFRRCNIAHMKNASAMAPLVFTSNCLFLCYLSLSLGTPCFGCEHSTNSQTAIDKTTRTDDMCTC